jgi:hypothetical protein
VAVDQPRRDQRIREVVLGIDAQRHGQIALGADPVESVALGDDRASLDPAPGLVAGQRRQSGVAPERACHRDPRGR